MAERVVNHALKKCPRLLSRAEQHLEILETFGNCDVGFECD